MHLGQSYWKGYGKFLEPEQRESVVEFPSGDSHIKCGDKACGLCKAMDLGQDLRSIKYSSVEGLLAVCVCLERACLSRGPISDTEPALGTVTLATSLEAKQLREKEWRRQPQNKSNVLASISNYQKNRYSQVKLKVCEFMADKSKLTKSARIDANEPVYGILDRLRFWEKKLKVAVGDQEWAEREKFFALHQPGSRTRSSEHCKCKGKCTNCSCATRGVDCTSECHNGNQNDNCTRPTSR